jgi:hypothetical protein
VIASAFRKVAPTDLSGMKSFAAVVASKWNVVMDLCEFILINFITKIFI